jgi:hypothetical protein
MGKVSRFDVLDLTRGAEAVGGTETKGRARGEPRAASTFAVGEESAQSARRRC